MSKKKIDNLDVLQEEINIPEDEIWTYQVPGLAAPHIGKPFKNAKAKRMLLALVILVAVSLSMYFSVRTVQSDTFEYTSETQGIEFTRFSNTGYIKEVTIDYVTDIVYDQENSDVYTNFSFTKDETQPITSVREYAFNCDGVIEVINIGPEVLEIDGKSFYSCWALQRIEVDENNPNYCDLDGVLYSKDMKTLICYPPNHDQYLRTKFGYETEPYRADATEEYINDIQTYVVPATVETLGELSMNYTNLRRIYLPEGLKRIETLALFKLHEPKDQWSNTPSLDNIYSYKVSDDVLSSQYVEDMELYGPELYDKYLTHMYGDYMTIPKNISTNSHYE